jgi:hypothetical protein
MRDWGIIQRTVQMHTCKSLNYDELLKFGSHADRQNTKVSSNMCEVTDCNIYRE